MPGPGPAASSSPVTGGAGRTPAWALVTIVALGIGILGVAGAIVAVLARGDGATAPGASGSKRSDSGS